MKTTTDVWNEIIERLPAGLTPTEQVVNRVNYFLFNFECGGWLYNLSPAAGTGSRWSELRETAKSVGEVGSHVVARALGETIEIAERANVQAFSTWQEYLAEADPSRAIDELVQVISKEIPALWDKLHEYTLAHFECERD